MDSARGANYLDQTVGQLVTEDYGRAAVFAEMGIDFCCGGGRTVAQACEKAGVSPEVLTVALEALDARRADVSRSDPRSWSVDRLVRHIEGVHHHYVRQKLPVLRKWTDKVARVHGRAHPELLEVRSVFAELASELERHMKEEEEVVFPHLAALESTSGDDVVGQGVPDSVVAALEHDHDHAGALTRQIRELTDGFAPPPDACSTYNATFALLAEFEEDLHRHVHLENNILFPRVRAAQAGPDSSHHAGRSEGIEA